MTKVIEIFDPAMCCSTGVCGPSVDPELVRITTDLKKLEQQGVEVRRYNLSQEMKSFADNPIIKKLLSEEGTAVLPVVLVDGELKKKQGYPTSAELMNWLGQELGTAQSKGCCGGGSEGCCGSDGC